MEWTGKCAEKSVGEGAAGGGAGGGGSGGPPLLTTGFDNSMPQIRNPVDRINVMAGELLQYQVPGAQRTHKHNHCFGSIFIKSGCRSSLTKSGSKLFLNTVWIVINYKVIK